MSTTPPSRQEPGPATRRAAAVAATSLVSRGLARAASPLSPRPSEPRPARLPNRHACRPTLSYRSAKHFCFSCHLSDPQTYLAEQVLVNTSTGTTSWSKLGRFRDGGAIAFGGGGSHGRLQHTADYNFRNNSHFFNISNEFTLQLTIHPVGPTSGRAQVVASKRGEWCLQISGDGTLQWRVHLADGWAQANSTRVLRNGSSFVVKATHAGSIATGRGTLKLFSCELAADSFACPLSTVEGSATGLLPLQTGTADIILGGAEQQRVGGGGETVDAATSFVGAMEEIQLARISFENITAHLFLGNLYP